MPVQFDASATISSLRLLNAAIHNAAHMALRDAVNETAKDAKATNDWQNRRPVTRDSITPTVGRISGEVVAGGASSFLQWGTRPHIIQGRNGGLLHFFVNGQEFFRRRVHHPGTKATNFLGKARDRGAITADYAASYYVSYAIQHAR